MFSYCRLRALQALAPAKYITLFTTYSLLLTLYYLLFTTTSGSFLARLSNTLEYLTKYPWEATGNPFLFLCVCWLRAEWLESRMCSLADSRMCSLADSRMCSLGAEVVLIEVARALTLANI